MSFSVFVLIFVFILNMCVYMLIFVFILGFESIIVSLIVNNSWNGNNKINIYEYYWIFLPTQWCTECDFNIRRQSHIIKNKMMNIFHIQWIRSVAEMWRNVFICSSLIPLTLATQMTRQTSNFTVNVWFFYKYRFQNSAETTGLTEDF